MSFPSGSTRLTGSPGAVGIRADGVVLLGHRVLAEPGRGPGIVEPGTKVQIGTAGSCCRGARIYIAYRQI